MATDIGTNTNNPVKGPTPRQGNAWWVFVVILLVLAGIFFAIGRSDNSSTEAPAASPASEVAPRDQITNTMRTGAEERPAAGVQLNDDGPATEDLTIPANDPANDQEVQHTGAGEDASPVNE